jgi:hypothetical protein
MKFPKSLQQLAGLLNKKSRHIIVTAFIEFV